MTVEARRVVAAPDPPEGLESVLVDLPNLGRDRTIGVRPICLLCDGPEGRLLFTRICRPFYSPQIKIGALPFSPALYVLWVPLGFRATCYYYRKAYFRSFFRQPPACAVPDRPGKYNGESRFPFILNNAHRYFLYLSIIVVGFLWWDAITAFDFHGRFGIGLGSVILLVNVIFLSGYTFGCHALRNIVGGGGQLLFLHALRQAAQTSLEFR